MGNVSKVTRSRSGKPSPGGRFSEHLVRLSHSAKTGTFKLPENARAGDIVINTKKRRLTYVLGNGQGLQYNIAVGKSPQFQWHGTTTLTRKAINPHWGPTARMRRADRSLPKVVKIGNKKYPYGTRVGRVMYLAKGLLRIHGTNNENSIGKNASSGCYRMYNEDARRLYANVKIGAKVIVT